MDNKVIYFEDIFEHLKTIISDEPMAFYISSHHNANALWLHLSFSDYFHLLYECEYYDLLMLYGGIVLLQKYNTNHVNVI